MSRSIIASSLFLLASFPGTIAAQQGEPVPAVAQRPAAKAAAPVYDEKADARKDVAAAVARAKKENRRVLIQWGANWCGWCNWLAATMVHDPALSHELLYEYEVLHVDVGRFDKNLDLAKELGAEFKSIPYLTILAADGKAVVHSNTEPFEIKEPTKAGDHHDAAKLTAFLTEHQAAPADAKDVRSAAFAQAKGDGKMVFLHFGAPWCGFCHRLENWMAQPEIATLLAKDFVDVKIDLDRMTGGKAVYAAELAAAGCKETGIPWFVFSDADGKQLANSDGPEGSIGFPSSRDEIALFAKMLEKCKRNLTGAEVQALIASLDAIRTADEAKQDEAKKKAGDAGK